MALFLREIEGIERETGDRPFANDIVEIVSEKGTKSDAKAVGRVTNVAFHEPDRGRGRERERGANCKTEMCERFGFLSRWDKIRNEQILIRALVGSTG